MALNANKAATVVPAESAPQKPIWTAWPDLETPRREVAACGAEASARAALNQIPEA